MQTDILIQTKLNRPPLPVDMVHRPRLTTWLEQHRHSRPLTIISAPAGYGKSTLISCWMENVDCTTAWVSLDEQDDDLGDFLGYFLAAIENIFPDALPESQALLTVSPLPPITATAKTLINELNQIETPFILVLDDYHLITTQVIQTLLGEIFTYPPRNLHLVLGTRMDPFLPLSTLRAKSQITEIRIQDLRFQEEEALLLFKNMLGSSVDSALVSKVDMQAEGWVTGLRLAALAMQHRIGSKVSPEKLSIHNRFVTEYLISEILAKQTKNLSDCLVKTSILNRFCAKICETICFPEADSEATTQPNLNGKQFIDWLSASNLFVIPLDDHHEWFRFHHLFQDFLQKELVSRFSTDEIAKLHIAAGHWFAQNGSIKEAIHHLLTGHDTEAAIQLIAQNRYHLMNKTQWGRLERWLNSFPPQTIEQSTELGMLEIWLRYHQGRWGELPAKLKKLNASFLKKPDSHLIGEINVLNALIAFHTGDIEGTLAYSTQSLAQLPAELWTVRILARNYWGGSLLMTGDIRGAYDAHYDAFEQEEVQTKQFKATLLAAVCDIHWINADLQGLKQAAKQCIALCQGVDQQQIIGFGQYHLGRAYYQQNRLVEAESLFATVCAHPYQNYGDIYVGSVCGLAMTYQAQGMAAKANETAEAASAFLLETGNTTQLPYILALQAELALRQGHLFVANQWAEKLDSVPPLAPMYEFFAPHLTLVKVWLAQNKSASLEKAAELLHQIEAFLSATHNARFLLETLAIHALLCQAVGDQPAATAALERSLQLAQPGGFIRVFANLGEPMAMLLRTMNDEDKRPFIQTILAAFPQIYNNLPTPLTKRELDVLQLLAERQTDREIAKNLIISTHTVNSHIKNIYTKLSVNGRRQAAQRAQELNLLS